MTGDDEFADPEMEESAPQSRVDLGPTATTLLLVRHAETEDNVSMRLSGWTDTDLSERGESPSSVKDAALRLGALNWGAFFGAQPDTPAKLAG